MSAAAHASAAVITELQRLLRKPHASEPQIRHVELALQLSEQPELENTGTFWKGAGVPKGSARQTVKGYRDRIRDESLLTRAQQPTSSDSPALGIIGDLSLTPRWIHEHAPGLRNFRSDQLVLSQCGRFATRLIEAENEYCEALVKGEIVYELPPANGESEFESMRRRDRHRRLEEAAIRELDGVAAAEHRAKRCKQRQDERAQEDEVAAAIERLVAGVERKANLEARRWLCPAGCAHGDPTCARLAFRLQCVPAWRSNWEWDIEHAPDPSIYGWKSRLAPPMGEPATEEERRAQC